MSSPLHARRAWTHDWEVLRPLNFPLTKKFDVILLHLAIEHIYALQNNLARIREILKPGWLFIFDFLDFIDELEANGGAESVSRLGHCHWLYLVILDVFYPIWGFGRCLPSDHARIPFWLYAKEPNPNCLLVLEMK